MTRSFEHLLVGGGVASAHALETMLQAGVQSSGIALICGEPEFPYNRPPLSKGYLMGKESRKSLYVKPAAFYEERGVTILRGTTVLSVNEQAQEVTLGDGERMNFSKLLLATGCTPRTLTVPGSTLAGILTLRTLEDADRIRAAAQPGCTAVIVGGGFIGLEVAAVLSQLGLHTTILHRGTALGDRLGSPEISSFLLDQFRRHGVDVRFETEVSHFEGTNTVKTVLTTTGETLPADVVIIGIGVVPETSVALNTSIVMEHGIRVNEYMETSAANIYAAGDVTSFFDPLYEKHRHIEHWATAIEHGKIAGQNMSGKRVPYTAVSSFFSDLFDVSYDYFGDAEGTDHMVQRGSFADQAITLFFLKEQVIRAAFTMGRPKERTQTIALIQKQRSVNPDMLANAAARLPSL